MKSVYTDLAYEHIRKRILSGAYPPGQALMTEVLAKEINVSRTPIRDALRKLESDGLVTIRAHLGASVKQMDLKEFREMCGMRLALEGYAAGLAAENHSASELEEIRFALEAMRELTQRIVAAPQEQPILAELMREDVRFHIAIMSSAKNELIKKEILRLHLINRAVSGSHLEQTPLNKADSDVRRLAILAKHDDIYAAIARSDAQAAKREMEYHLQEMMEHNWRTLVHPENSMLSRALTADELVYSS